MEVFAEVRKSLELLEFAPGGDPRHGSRHAAEAEASEAAAAAAQWQVRWAGGQEGFGEHARQDCWVRSRW